MTEQSTALYGVLGLTSDATSAQIKKAFRNVAMRLHPDHGGGQDEFAAAKHAYDVLSDPKRRARYDATGDDRSELDRGQDTERELKSAIYSLAHDALLEGKVDLAHTDMTTVMLGLVETKTQMYVDARMKLERKKDRATTARKRMKRKAKAKGEDVFATVLDRHIQELAIGIQDHHDKEALLKRISELVASYDYDWTERPKSEFRPGFIRPEYHQPFSFD